MVGLMGSMLPVWLRAERQNRLAMDADRVLLAQTPCHSVYVKVRHLSVVPQFDAI